MTLCLSWGVVLLAATPTAAGTPSDTTLIAITGETAFDGSGTLTGFGYIVSLNNAGQVAFQGDIDAGDGGTHRGLFRADGTTAGQTTIARTGQAAYDGSGTIADFNLRSPQLNDAGQVAFSADILETGTTDGTTTPGIFLGDGSVAGQATIIRHGQPAYDGSGPTSQLYSYFNLNNAGQVLFSSSATLYRGDGTLEGQTTYEAGGDDRARFFALNDQGEAALNTTPPFFGPSSGTIFRDDGTGNGTTTIAETGDASFDGDYMFQHFGDSVPAFPNHSNFGVAINELGAVAFHASITREVPGAFPSFEVTEGLYRGDGTAENQATIARLGDPAFDGNGVFSALYLQSQGAIHEGAETQLNDSGEVLFRADLENTLDGDNDNYGIFRSDGTAAGQTAIIREGQATPDGNGIFRRGGGLSLLNNQGQVAFRTFLSDTAGGDADDTGIFLYDDTLGLVTVAREGDDFLGSTLTLVGLRAYSFNDLGQIAYAFRLADGREGIALWALAAEILGDYNGDGFVSQADLDLVLLNWGASTLPGGFDPAALGGGFDGLISQNELDGVLLNWGNGTPPAGSLSAIPEPGTLTLVGLGAAGLLRRERAVG